MSRSSKLDRSPGYWAPGTALVACLALAAALSIPTAPATAGKTRGHIETGGREQDGEWLMSGTWRAGRDDDRDGFWISFRAEKNGSRTEHWTRVRADEVEGFDLRRIPVARTSVDFRVKRDAGAIHAVGEFSGSRGAGDFTLELDSAFGDALAKRGIGRPTRAQHARLLLADASFELLDALAREKYPTPTLETLMRLATHGVTVDYVTGMAEAGHRLPSLEELIRARDHGVDPHFVHAMAEAGYRNLDFEMLLRARDHGADPNFIEGLAEAGYKNLPLSVVIRARDHGVDGMYIESMLRAGFRDMTLEDLIRARDHGVTSGFARRARARRPGISLDDVIAMRDRGVSP